MATWHDELVMGLNTSPNDWYDASEIRGMIPVQSKELKNDFNLGRNRFLDLLLQDDDDSNDNNGSHQWLTVVSPRNDRWRNRSAQATNKIKSKANLSINTKLSKKMGLKWTHLIS
jgi:hypothetical protein